MGGLTLREVARRARLSHAAPGRLFGDLRGMLTAFAVRGFHELARREQEAIAAAPTGSDALAAVGRAYVQFALDEPEAFDLMFREEHLDVSDPAYVEATTAALGALFDALKRAFGEGSIRDEDRTAVAVAAWSLVHGLATLHAGGRLRERIPDDPKDLAERITALFVAALRAHAQAEP
jgi:AcrR family transcriptional regulator